MLTAVVRSRHWFGFETQWRRVKTRHQSASSVWLEPVHSAVTERSTRDKNLETHSSRTLCSPSTCPDFALKYIKYIFNMAYCSIAIIHIFKWLYNSIFYKDSGLSLCSTSSALYTLLTSASISTQFIQILIVHVSVHLRTINCPLPFIKLTQWRYYIIMIIF